MNSRSSLGVLGLVGLTAVALAVNGAERRRQSPVAAVPSARTGDRLPGQAAFVANHGQWPETFRYRARLGGVTVFVEDDGWMLNLVECSSLPAERRALLAAERGAAVRLRFVAAQRCALVAGPRLAGTCSYFLGNERAGWRTGVPRYGGVTHRGLYPGVDATVYGKDWHVEYDLMLQPGADLEQIEIAVEGADRLRLEPDGTLVIDTAAGPLRQARPVTWEVAEDGVRRPVPVCLVLRGADRFGFEAPDWSGTTALVIDPGLDYSTFVGSDSGDFAMALAVDPAGVVTIAGATASVSYPTTPGAWDRTHGGMTSYDAFVTRLDRARPPAQQLLYSTFVGGRGREIAHAIAVDAAGVVTIAGETTSTDYPVTSSAWDTTHNGGFTDGFVTRIDPSLSQTQQLVYSTFVGGSDFEQARALAVRAAGDVTIAGFTWSTDYPTTARAWDTTHNGPTRGQDAFVTRLDPSRPAAQQLVYSTFLGGGGSESVAALVVDGSGGVTVAGGTTSADYPTTAGAWDRTHDGPANGEDVFVTRLAPWQPAAQQLVYSTFLGGGNGEAAYGLNLDAAQAVTVVGTTLSPDFPTTSNAWDRTYKSTVAGFVSRLDPLRPAAQQLVYSTYLGGGGYQRPAAVAVDSAGVLTIAGHTTSADYPTTAGAWDTTHNDPTNGSDGFVTRLDPARPAARQMVYSTFVGGSGSDEVTSLVVDQMGVATIAGSTYSLDYPTTFDAWDRTHAGPSASDVFVTRLDLLPIGVRRYGGSTPGCKGWLAAGVTSMPRIGNATFGLTCTNAPPNAPGLVPWALGGSTAPVRVLGVDLWLDPRSLFLVAVVASDARGAADVPVPLPQAANLVGLKLHAQLVWLGPSAPAPCPPLGFSASAALEITIQP